jgi:hypothetical protein
VEERKEDLPAQCPATRNGAAPRHESEEAAAPAAGPAGALELPVAEVIEELYSKRFGFDPVDHSTSGSLPEVARIPLIM